MTDLAIEEKLADILQSGSQAQKFKITLVFRYKISPKYGRAVELARRNPTYKEEGTGEWVHHSATYSTDEVDDLFDLWNLVYEWGDTEVLVNHKNIPYGSSFWLPLMWFYRIK
jgi:hypothetical protein